MIFINDFRLCLFYRTITPFNMKKNNPFFDDMDYGGKNPLFDALMYFFPDTINGATCTMFIQNDIKLIIGKQLVERNICFNVNEVDDSLSLFKDYGIDPLVDPLIMPELLRPIVERYKISISPDLAFDFAYKSIEDIGSYVCFKVL